MKKILILTTAMLSLSSPAMAQNYISQPIEQQIQVLQTQPVQDPVMEEIAYLQKEWARIKYQIAEKSRQIKALKTLRTRASKVTANYPDRAEPKIWEGIILSTEAGISGGLGALKTVKRAQKLFKSSLAQDSKALNGSAYTSMGSLYYQVPGWPIGFGDDKKAEKYLKKALQINPNGIDPNFFYADFLIESHRYKEAEVYLKRALQASDRPMRPLADAGRRQETKAALAKIKRKINTRKSYN